MVSFYLVLWFFFSVSPVIILVMMSLFLISFMYDLRSMFYCSLFLLVSTIRVVFWVIFLSYALYFLHCFSKSRNFLIIDCLLKSFILKNMFSSCSTMLTENSLFPYNVIFIFQASVRACWVWDSIFPKILSMRDSKIVT